MAILQSIRDYTKKHRSGILVTMVISGSAYLVGRYATGQLWERQQRTAAERDAKEKLKQRFQQNQNDCVFTVLSLLPTLGDQILNEMNIEACWAKLQESRKREKQQQQQGQDGSNSESGTTTTTTGQEEEEASKGNLDKEEKYHLWEEIKVKSFTRTLTSLYSVALLTLLTHVQLDLLGRFAYAWTVSMADEREPAMRFLHNPEEHGPIDPQTEQMFLNTSWWLLHRGWRTCTERVQEAVDDVVGSLPLKRIVTHHDAQVIIRKLREEIEDASDSDKPRLSSCVLPNDNEGVREMLLEMDFANASPQTLAKLKRLMDVTKSYMNSPKFDRLYSACLDRVFDVFYQHTFGTSDADSTAKRVTLANLLPTISRQAHRIIAGNEYLNELVYCKEVEDFSAMVYKEYDGATHRN